MINALVYNATTIQFPANPLRETSPSGEGFQVMGRDSNGASYIYDKSRLIRTSHPLVYTQVSLAMVNSLLALQDATHGDRYLLTWYDHDGNSHAVRIMEIRYREVTAGKYRVEMTLEEDVFWSAATGTDLLSTYAAPLWILKMLINGTTYHFSDSSVYIPAWDVHTIPWVGSWGAVQGGIDNSLGEYQSTDISASLLIDSIANPNIETLALAYPLESSAVELYLCDCPGQYFDRAPRAGESVNHSLLPPISKWWPALQSIVTVGDGKIGTTALRLVGAGGFPNAGQLVKIDKSKTYKTRFWAKATGVTTGVLYFSLRQFQDAAGLVPCSGNNGRSPYQPASVKVWQNKQWVNQSARTNQWLLHRYQGKSSLGAPSYDQLVGCLCQPTETVIVTDRLSFMNDVWSAGSGNEYYLGVAHTMVYSPAPWTWHVYMVHDDGCTIYVNDALQYSNGVYLGGAYVDIAFPAGWAQLLFLWNEQTYGDGFGFAEALSGRAEITNMNINGDWVEYIGIWEPSIWQTGCTYVLAEFLENYPVAAGYWDIQDFEMLDITVPELKYTGHVSGIKLPDETRVDVVIEDASSRLKSYIGRKLCLTDYPDADPADVGKVLPIPYGVVKKYPLPAIVAGSITSLPLSIDGVATSFQISDAAGLTVGSIIGIDQESMYISGISGTTITVTRGYNTTTAGEHNRGAKIVEYVPTVYMAADCAVDSVDKVWARINQADMLIYPVTGITVEVYSGNAGSELAGYSGKAVVRLPSAPVFIRQLLRAYPTLSGSIQDYAISDPNHNHAISGSMALPTQYATGTGLQASQSSGTPRIASNSLSFAAYPGTLVQQTIHFTLSFSNAEIIYCDGVQIYNGVPWTGTTTYHRTTTGAGNSTAVEVRSSSGTVTVTTTACSRDVLYTNSAVDPSISGNSKTLANNGSVAVSSVGNITIQSFIPEMIMADVTHLHTVPEVFGGILTRAGMSNTTLVVTGGSLDTPTAMTGPELITNGGFDSASSWSLGTDPAAELVVNGGFGSTASWSLPLITAGSPTNYFSEGDFTAVGSWSVNGSNANISSGALNISVSGTTSAIASHAVALSGTYTVSYELKNYVSGSIQMQVGSSNILNATANGVYSVSRNMTGESAIGFLSGASGFVGSIDNIKMEQTTQVPAFSISSGSLTGATTTVDGTIAQQTGCSLISGWSYTASFQVTACSAGSCKLDIGGRYFTALQTAPGTYTLNLTATVTETVSISVIAGAAGFSGSIDNVSIIRAAGSLTISSSRLSYSTVQRPAASQTGIALVSGYGYTATFQIASYTSGSCYLDIGGGKYVSGAQSTTGTYEFTFTAVATESATINIIPSAGGFIGSVDSVSISATSKPPAFILPGGTALLNGVINEYRQADEWLNQIAFQLRSWFRYDHGTPTLYVRPDALLSTKTIPACRVTNDGRTVHSRRKTATSEIINRINLLYDRDWTGSGDTAYRQVLSGSDAASSATYGEHERPELFRFDWITSQSIAQTILNFYLTQYHERHWIHEFEVYLDQHGLEFGAVVTLGFSGGTVAQIVNAGVSPGDCEQIDKIKIRAVA